MKRRIVDSWSGFAPCLFGQKQRIFWFLFVAALFALQVLPRVWTDSALTDEAWETTSGYYYWLHGDVVSSFNLPPLAVGLNAFPLLFAHLKTIPHFWADNENRAYAFYYVSNLDKLDLVLALPRVVTLVFSLGTGFLLYLLVLNETFILFATTLLLWAFEPNLLAFSTVSKTDPVFAFFCVLSLLLFLRGQKETSWKWGFARGFSVGLAITAKLSGLCLLPVYFLLDFLMVQKNKSNIALLIKRWILEAVGLATAVFFVFLPGTIKLNDHLNPFYYFYLRLSNGLLLSRHFQQIQPSEFYFFGHWYPSELWWQFPVVFAMKSTIPFLLFLAMGIAGLCMGKVKVPVWIWLFPLMWIGLLQLLPLFFLRYLLPAYPAMILLAARGFEWVWEIGDHQRWRSLRWFLIFACFWHAASTLSCFSNQVAYFNDFISPSQKLELDYHYYDLNQDLKRLGRVSQERHWAHVKLAYVGQDDPYYYGLSLWEPWSVKDLSAPQAGMVYVVQKHLLISGYENFPIHQSWAAFLKPTGFLGDSWAYYEIPGAVTEGDKSPLLPSTPYLVYQNAPYRHQN